VLEAGKRFGLQPKIHADQLTQMEASVLAARVGAISADHLEKIDAAGIAAMKDAGCIAVLLPGCSFFLGAEQAPARTMLDADLPVALATDFNPGSSMVESLPLVMCIGCVPMRLSPTEAVVAATANAAAAVDRHRRVGAIAVGMQADLVILDVPNHERWLSEPGRNCVAGIVKRGALVHQART
jgi:imidazolonepropionase